MFLENSSGACKRKKLQDTLHSCVGHCTTESLNDCVNDMSKTAASGPVFSQLSQDMDALTIPLIGTNIPCLSWSFALAQQFPKQSFSFVSDATLCLAAVGSSTQQPAMLFPNFKKESYLSYVMGFLSASLKGGSQKGFVAMIFYESVH